MMRGIQAEIDIAQPRENEGAWTDNQGQLHMHAEQLGSGAMRF
jgi:hypothetical protein